MARFSAFSNTLVRESEPFQPDQASVKVPKLSWETRKGENHAETGNVVESGWYQTEYVVSRAVSLAPQRPSKFRGNPNLDCPSQKLAAFMQGEGDAWGWRDEDVRALFLAWANAVQPSATTPAGRASAWRSPWPPAPGSPSCPQPTFRSKGAVDRRLLTRLAGRRRV